VMMGMSLCKQASGAARQGRICGLLVAQCHCRIVNFVRPQSRGCSICASRSLRAVSGLSRAVRIAHPARRKAVNTV
jgi:hypothetical protein